MMLDSLLFELAPPGMSYVELICGSIGVLSTVGLDGGFFIQLGCGVKSQLAVEQPGSIEEHIMKAIDEAQIFFAVDLVNTNTNEKEHYND